MISTSSALSPSSEERQQLRRIQWHVAAGWLSTIHLAVFSAWFIWISPTSLRPKSQIALGIVVVFLTMLSAGLWCALSLLKYPRPSWNRRAMKLGGLWVMTGAVIFQAALQWMLGRFSMVGVGGVVGMAICVAAMWVFYWRGREEVAK